MIRKVGKTLVVASTIALAMGCAQGEATDEEGTSEPANASGDDEQESIEPSTDDVMVSGTSSSVSEPTKFQLASTTQTTLSAVWSAPTQGKPVSYVVYLNGTPKASTSNKRYTYAKLACGTSYTLEVASRDADKKISALSRVTGTTAACTVGNAPTQTNPPSPSNQPSGGDSPTKPGTPSSPATGYAAAVQQDAPIAYYRLDETLGTRAADSVGRHDGTYDGPTLGAKGLDGAASFDGVDDVVTVKDAAELRLNGSFSIEFMAKLGGDANSFPGILAKGSATGGETGFIVYYSPSHPQPAFKRAGVDGMDTSVAGALSSAGFKHFVFTYDDAAAVARWYVGGKLDRTFSDVRFPLNLDSSTFQLGRGDVEGGKVQYGNQVLDEVALYATALSAERVKSHFDASGLGAAPSSPSNPTTSVPPTTLPIMQVPPTPATNPLGAFPIGVCAYKTSDFARIQAMGMHHVRMDRPSPATIELARSYGIEVLPIADYGFADLSADGSDRSPPKPEHRATWAKRMVDTWRGMQNPPKVIEVWNEPWHQGFYGGKPNPSDYLELVKAFAAEAWKQWPNVILLVSADSGMSEYPTFRKDLLAADRGRFLNDPRILPTTHNYVENRTPTQVTGNSCTYDLNRYQCAFQDFKSHGHPNPQVWITEFGWESNSGGQGSASTVSEQVQAQYTLDALEMFRKSGMVAAAYSFMLNSGDRWNYNWLRPDNSDKPVVSAVKNYLATH